jgi:hypothetical protein
MGASNRPKGRISYAVERYGGSGAFGGRTLNDYSGSDEGDSKPRVFISFHSEDQNQVELLRHQAKDSRFQVSFTDYSVKVPYESSWKTHTEKRIEQSSVVFVMIGGETHQRAAVNWEVEKAYELGKPVVGVRIYRNEDHLICRPMEEHKATVVNWNMVEMQDQLDKNT